MVSGDHGWNAVEACIGADLGSSPPVTIDQDDVDVHAQTTGDAQWIHNDPERARRDGPFGGPIVQGFLLLAQLTRLSSSLDLAAVGPVSMLVNYGFDRVRFVTPVSVGAPICLRAQLAGVRPRADGSAVIELDVRLELVSVDTPVPAVSARWLFLAVR